MSPHRPEHDAQPLAEQLLDAQVAYVVALLTGDALAESVRRDVAALWDAASQIRLDDLVTAGEVGAAVGRLLATAPGSVATSTLLDAWTDVVLDGPPVPTTPEDLVDRADVEAVLAEALASRGTFTGAARVDRLAESPAVGALASRFISRIVMEAVQLNRAVAERIPGMGSLMSLGTSAASRVAGVADKPLQVVGDTAGKGAAIAVRRLNKVVAETIEDPAFAAAVMEVWDLQAGQPIDGIAEEEARAGIHRMVGLLQGIAVGAAGTPQVEAGAAAFVEAFFAIYGEHPPTTLLEELGITRDDVLAAAEVVVPRAIALLHADGTLEVAVRDRLAPFFASPEVVALLAGE